MQNVVEEYLVKVGSDIDSQSLNAAMQAINGLKSTLSSLGNGAAILGVAGAISAIGKAAIGTITSVAKADMEYQKLGKDMWVTADSAKGLKVAMDTMGVSADDIAWVPELREQFFRLRETMDDLATPVDADEQLKYIRSIGYDLQNLWVQLKMFKEWVAYYLIKYLAGPIQEFKKFIQWLSDKLSNNISEYAKRVAKFLSDIIMLILSVGKAIFGVISSVIGFVESLPALVKKWAVIFAVVGAAIMASPFGLFLMALGAAALLIQDLVYYMNGWNSSKTMAPIWEALLSFVNGDGGKAWMTMIRDFLTWIAETLENIFNLIIDNLKEIIEGIEIDKTMDLYKEKLGDLATGVKELTKALHKFFKEFIDNHPHLKTFGILLVWR